MGVKAELSDFLNHLPAVDSPDERKALLTFSGAADLGIYLDWQGSNVAFTERLLEELSRRGRTALSGFLAGLRTTPQLANSLERQEQLADLQAQVEELDEGTFLAQFPASMSVGAAIPRSPADPAMLAAALTSEVLAPYYRLGADRLRQSAGDQAVALAEQTAERVQAALASDVAASALFSLFAQNPQPAVPGLVAILKTRFTTDRALARDLTDLIVSASVQSEARVLQALARVSQQIGVAKDDIVGAVVGHEILLSIEAKIDVEQHSLHSKTDSSLVRDVWSSEGALTIGGAHYHGDQINTGGGAYIHGNVQGDIDFVGRDRVIYRDAMLDNRVRPEIGSGTEIREQRPAPASEKGAERGRLSELFADVFEQVNTHCEIPEAERQALLETVRKIEKEVAKGQEANSIAVERWLKYLGAGAPDILAATVAVLTDPALGVASALRDAAQQALART